MSPRVKSMLASGVAVIALGLFAYLTPGLRRELIFDLTYWDAPPGDPPELGGGTGPGPDNGPDNGPGAGWRGSGPGLAKAPRTRVVLIDGLDAQVTPALAHWTAGCNRGLAVTVDVGFPTVSLPVETALWSGLTQQQTGIVHRGGGKDGKYGRPLDPPLRGIPSQVPRSIAIAEDHGWIVRSLGFAQTAPPAGAHPADDLTPAAWAKRWETDARAAVESRSPLVFIHVLRVDTAGHKFGFGAQYGRIAAEADALLGTLFAAAPGDEVRWFLLSDHGHLGGHGGEERSLRHVEACILGAGMQPQRGPLIHIVDVARAIADSTGTTLDTASRGRPLSVALAAPLSDDQAVPPLALSRGAIAIFLLAVALGSIVWGARRWWLAPWWFAIACVTTLVGLGEPSLSVGWIYAYDGRAMLESWIPGLLVAIASTWFGLGKATLARVLAAQLGVPILALAAAITASGAWPTLFGAEVAPVVPHYTAYMLVLVLMVGVGAAAIALAIFARLVYRAIKQRDSEPTT